MRNVSQEGRGPLLSLVSDREQEDRDAGETGGLPTAEHPSFSALDRVARGGSLPDERRQIVRHLLTGCPGCCSRLRTLRLGPPPCSSGLDAAIDRAFSRVQEIVASVSETRERLARLLALPPEQQLAVAITDEFCAPEVCRLLLEETEEAMNGSPVHGLRLGRIAAAMARRLAARDPERFGELRMEARRRLTELVRVLGRAGGACTAAEGLTGYRRSQARSAL